MANFRKVTITSKPFNEIRTYLVPIDGFLMIRNEEIWTSDTGSNWVQALRTYVAPLNPAWRDNMKFIEEEHRNE